MNARRFTPIIQLGFLEPILPEASYDAFDCPAYGRASFLWKCDLSVYPNLFRLLIVGLLANTLSFSVWAQNLVGEVVAIADGDTLTVLDADRVQHKIRLAGIDAPERKQPFGQRSRQMLADLVFRKQVEVLTEKKDRYGRTIGKVMHQGRDVNLILVAQGMAWHYKQYAREQSAIDRQLYAQAEDEARAQRRGLWADSHPIPPWSWRSGERGASPQ
ncbi:thermonuclease family protein [Hydrogenophaga sp.]|uniref:thermonuclease family protein n=1 Tax=Hydrogenophaga sp. TaxID=1904254 RepID=UPI0026186F87|nr:thermonuclease family protein [Hydrogenophaga sp.]